ncbi:DUF2057 domain-containing protein [Shewanella schlegeliana]|uniref:DUF2057 domain-containing protein n=1 Tax=Shewanella schlegeliana TaxID=190308 RepID=A0ABS1SY01_9GAMM|nr:DUF2057 domain-containing protein [Shewanella schlegeliana]MBL4913225.1 DUF2057 domain-containing protein [Shewanella schlegeliana]MCL1109180.1 DUF2057 domain-containing protein [Shewanella schlegeliana]GIU24248.1 UPF0319 protein [Shewanella schlegeliana]
MKPRLTITALLALCGSSAAFAADFNIPMAFEYIAVDGQEVETSLFNHKSEIQLDKGTHKIAIRYNDLVEDDFSDSETNVKSNAFIVTIDVDGDFSYQLKPADGEFVKNPKRFAKAPQVVVTREDNGLVNYKVTQTNITEESFVSRLFSGNDATDVDAEAAVATGAAAAVSTPTAPVSKPSPAAAATLPAVAATHSAAPATATTAEDAAKAEQMLQYWWLHADEQTRKEFMSWAIKQL